jgi:hypothetical protein
VEFKPNTNAAESWNIGHIKERSHMGGVGQKKETKKLNMGDILSIQESI